MKITYKCQIDGEERLAPYIKEFQPRFKKGAKHYVILFEYDIPLLEDHLVEEFKQVFDAQGIEAAKHGPGRLWISSPEPWKLDLRATITHHSGIQQEHQKGYLTLDRFCADYGRKVDEQPRKSGFKTKYYSVFREIPSVKVGGSITSAYSEQSDPKPILDILNSLGYASEITTHTELAGKRLNEAIGRLEKLIKTVENVGFALIEAGSEERIKQFQRLKQEITGSE